MNIASKGPGEQLSFHGSSAGPGVVARPILPATWADRTTLLVAAATLIRLLIATATGLSDTEAYYAQWARVPALSYYDHPPLIAWTTWLVTHVAGGWWAVRLGPVLYAAVFDALVYRLGARLFSPRAGFLAVAILHAIPVFFLTGFLLNPEALLAPLWALFLLLLLDLRDHDEPWRPLALGAVVGVAFLAKYTAILAVPVTLVYVGGSKSTRRWLRRPAFYAAGLVALVVTTPVIAWNASHAWPSMQLHLSERMGHAPGETLAGALWRVASAQWLFFQPIVLPALAALLGYAVLRSRRDERHRFVVSTSLPVLAFLLTMMVRAGDSEPHWTMVGYLPLVLAGAGVLDESTGLPRRLARGVLWSALALSAAVAGLYTLHLRSPALAKALPSYDPRVDPAAETLGWDRVSAAIGASTARLGPGTVVAGAHNVLCGHLEAALDDTPPVYCASPRRTEYDFIGRRTPPAGSPVVFVDSDRYPQAASAALPAHACGPARDVEIDREGLHLGTYHLYECVPAIGGRR